MGILEDNLASGYYTKLAKKYGLVKEAPAVDLLPVYLGVSESDWDNRTSKLFIKRSKRGRWYIRYYDILNIRGEKGESLNELAKKAIQKLKNKGYHI